MAVVKNFENYVSVITQSSSLLNLISIDAAFLPEQNQGSAAKQITAIQTHLAQANNYYLKRQYQPAIDEYKLVQGLIYHLLDRTFRPSQALRPNLMMPITQNLLDQVLDVSMEMLNVLPIPVDDPFLGAKEVQVDEAIKAYTDLGLTIKGEIPDSAVHDSLLGTMYAERGEWETAASFYQRAGDALERNRAAPEEVAGQMLNLGGVYVQSGRTQEALNVLTKALEGFARADDLVGQAQANFNIGAAFIRDGLPEDAARFLEEGNQLLARAQGKGIPHTKRTAAPEVGRVTTSRSLVSIPTALDGRSRLIDQVAPLNFSIDPNELNAVAEAQGTAVTYRMAGKAVGWTVQPLKTRAETTQREFTRSLSFIADGKPAVVQWKAGNAAPKEEILAAYYDKRVSTTSVAGLNHASYSIVDTTLNLPHLYNYVIPVALGDCYHSLGEFTTAETYYLKAANYTYINPKLEVPALWQKLAKNVLAWGDWLYKADEFQNALTIYRKVMQVPGTVPVVDVNAPLHSHTQLKVVGNKVRAMLENYAQAGAGTLNPMLASIVLEIRARLLQLNAGLDFLGIPAQIIPIWTFEYLQNVARYFAQKASQAERDFISFRDRAENEAFTRQQLQQQADLAQAERELARQQREAAEFERNAYSAARDLAQLRTDNANDNRSDYAAMSWERIQLETSNAWYSSQNPWELDNTIEGSGPDAGRHVHEVIADNTRRRGVITRDYELASMNRQIQEMQQAQVVAQAQANGAQARVEAAQQMEVVADLRRQAAIENLSAFDSQLFTPGVWNQMADFMRNIAQSYFNMALRIARLMQHAYNFEHDLDRKFIRADYSSLTVMGMLAADALLRDVDSFTYDLITTAQHKAMPVRQTVSLASRYPFLFETAFRATGRMAFETRLEDFDLAHPGTYSQRIESIEVEVEGILPPEGVRGTLTNSGISRYRTPANALKFRVQPKETLVLSEYRIRGDAIVFPADPNRLKLFEGAGTAGTWEIEFSPAANDLDFRLITDVRLTFYYHARYDAGLAQIVKANLAALAGANQLARNLPLRWTHPDLFFHFQATGQLHLTLTPLDFPYSQLDPQIAHLAMIVMTEPGTNPAGWVVRLGTPAHPATIAAQPNANGEIVANGGHPWVPLASGDALGDYLIEIRADENPALVVNGALDLRKIRNIVLILEYTYTPRV